MFFVGIALLIGALQLLSHRPGRLPSLTKAKFEVKSDMAGKPWQPLEVEFATSPHGSEHGAFASKPCRYCQFSVSDGVPKSPRLHQMVGLEWNANSRTSTDGLSLQQDFRYLQHDQTIHDGAIGCWAHVPGVHHPETKRHPRLACRMGRPSFVCQLTNEP